MLQNKSEFFPHFWVKQSQFFNVEYLGFYMFFFGMLLFKKENQNADINQSDNVTVLHCLYHFVLFSYETDDCISECGIKSEH